MGIMKSNINSSIFNIWESASACKILFHLQHQESQQQEAVVICSNTMPVEHEFSFTIPLNSVLYIDWFIQFYIIPVSYIVGIMQKISNTSETKSI